jgi:nicotinamidase-related amidase
MPVTALRRKVFVDVCTQFDYLSPQGGRPCEALPQLRRHLKQMMAFARWAHIHTLSCLETQRPKDVAGRQSQVECILGTAGFRKPHFTLLPNHIVIPTDNSPCISLDIFRQHQQAILQKVSEDPFANPKFDRLLTELPVGGFVLFGVGLETTLRTLALGLLMRQREVTVISDACGTWDLDRGDMTLRQLAAKNCRILSARDFIRSELAQGKRFRSARLRRSRFVA